MTAGSDRGSALVLALLVTFVITLLGVAFLLMAQTETRIARNEARSTQALYLAEAGAQTVRGWFDRPGTALGFPDPAVVRRAQREVIDESDPYEGAPIAGAGEYKQNVADATDVDLDGDGLADLFRRPYRGGIGVEHAMMGREGAPDMRIDDQDADDAVKSYLSDLSRTLFGTSLDSPGQIARISRIDVYAPPYVSVAGNWSRYGLGTVKVTARVYRLDSDGDEAAVLAEHSVETVLNEIPYGTPVYGPLHACGDLTFGGTLSVHWGAVTASGDILGYDPGVPTIVPGLPRQPPPGPRLDRLWVSEPEQADCLLEYTTRVDSADVPDPWLRVVAKGTIVDADEDAHPYPPQVGLPETVGLFPVRNAVNPCVPGSASALGCCDRSNLFQHHPLVGCPEYDYDFWKTIARSGRSGVHYYVHTGAGLFKEGGVDESAELTFHAITHGKTGLFFFDTEDQLAPHDDDNDGVPDNLIEAPIAVTGNWQSAGFVFLNADTFLINGPLTPPTDVELRAPGEPFLDEDANRLYDDGEAWINLAYPPTLGDAFVVDALDNTTDDGGANPGGPVRNSTGPVPISSPASFYGILYTSGSVTASGSGIFYGSVICPGRRHPRRSRSGAGLLLGRPHFHGLAPRGPGALPRVAATRWTDEP